MTYPPQPGEHNPAYPTSGQPAGWGPPQPAPYPPQPDPTMPYPGPPAYDPGQPYPVPPGYDPGQPYGAAPQYGVPGFPPPAPPKKSNTTIVVGVVALALVLCVGVVTSLYLIGANAAEDEAKRAAAAAGKRTEATTEASAGPTTEPAVDPTIEEPPATIKIAAPAKLGGRPRLTGDEFDDITEDFQDSIADEFGPGESFGAFYGVPDKENVVIAIAFETKVPLPGAALAGIFTGIGNGGLKVSNLTEAGTGRFGGAAKCGDANSEGVPVAVCSWADEGSIGMIMWYFKKARQVKAEFPKLRAQIETKS